jgi:hypothetical protein
MVGGNLDERVEILRHRRVIDHGNVLAGHAREPRQIVSRPARRRDERVGMPVERAHERLPGACTARLVGELARQVRLHRHHDPSRRAAEGTSHRCCTHDVEAGDERHRLLAAQIPRESERLRDHER